MQSPEEFYTRNKESYTQEFLKVKKKLRTMSLLRLVVFIATITIVYFSFNIPYFPAVTAVLGAAAFLFLISRYTDIQYQKNRLEALININDLELKALNGDISSFDSGSDFIDGDHAYSHDLDLFGEHSFYQSINRTTTVAGKDLLAKILMANNIDKIEEKQKAICELKEQPDWMQEFRATASLIKTSVEEKTIIDWLENHKPITPSWIRGLLIAFSLASVAFLTVISMGILPFGTVFIWLFIAAGILSPYLKRINHLSFHTSKIQDTFDQYYKLLMLIEKSNFSSSILNKEVDNIHTQEKKASMIMRDFSKALDALDQRNNIFFMIPANGFFLWDLWQVRRIDHWIAKYGVQVKKWMETVAFFDMQISLATFAFNRPNYSFPEITDDHNTHIKDLGHPLVDEEKLVRNDFSIKKGEFYIITGANMAGKSTFLRTVSLHCIMANTGLPVCASHSKYAPIKLITSMRTSDSLSDDESYFFSELKRLKYIIDKIEDETYFIVLDEILKGTNSKDKAEGSAKFLEKLSQSHSTGIIATHDLSLCEIADKYPDIENYYFDAYIENDELSFDYKFKEGICQNMNASFLLQKMGIV